VAAVLIAVILLLATLGSFFPQLSSSVAADPERLATWEAAVRARYGALTNLLSASGAFRCFRSPVFLVPVALLALATLVCTLDRWRRLWRRAFHQPVRCSAAALSTAPHTASLTAPDAAALPRIVHECLERRGFRAQTEVAPTNQPTNQPTIYLRGDRYRLSPLATLVTHLAVLLLLVGVVLSSGYGWREQITIGPGQAAEVGHGSGLALRYEEFTIARYPDGSVASYEAEISIAEEGREVKRGRVRVNEPLTYGGVGLYLQSYAGTEGRYSVTLLAVRDPGYGLVITAGLLLLLGLTVSFNFPHCWVHARIEPQGTLRLVGRADRRACDFGREFEALVKEIGVRCSH
jgi:cytochrome c biogenesis protein